MPRFHGPGKGDPLTLFHPGRTGSPDLRRPSLIQLRLRALVGVSARAEVLKLMLADPDRRRPHLRSRKAPRMGKAAWPGRSEMLTMAGIVQVQPAANRLLYRLSRPGELSQTLQWLPSVFPDWWPIFTIIEALTDYAHSVSGPPSARMAGLKKLLLRIDHDLHRLDIAEHVPRAVGHATVAEFEHWALDFLAEQTGHIQTAGATREITYVIRHLAFGGWLGTVIVSRRQPRPFESGEGSPGRGDGCGSAGTSDVQGCGLASVTGEGGQRHQTTL